MNLPDKINESIEFLRSRGIDKVDVAVILGTGLGGSFVNEIAESLLLDYQDIPYFPEATVEFHHGKLIYGSISDKKVLAFQGRFHYYEGYSMEEVTYPVRIAQTMHARALLISNASGCMNPEWDKGDLVMIDDHINLQNDSPLRGKHFEEFGSRFPDMSRPYDRELSDRLREIAKRQNTILREGVYVGVTGPHLETRAEYRFLRLIGADVVGMSTVPEVIVANQAALPCLAVSVVTDLCDPDDLMPADIADIVATAGHAESALSELFVELIIEMP